MGNYFLGKLFLLISYCSFNALKADLTTELAKLSIGLQALKRLIPEAKELIEKIDKLVQRVESTASPDELRHLDLGNILSEVLTAKKAYEDAGGTQDLSSAVKKVLNKINIVYQAYPMHDFITPQTSKEAAQTILSFLLDKLIRIPFDKFDEEQASNLTQLYLQYKEQNFDVKPYQDKIVHKARLASDIISHFPSPISLDDIEDLLNNLMLDQFLIKAADTLNLLDADMVNSLAQASKAFKGAQDLLILESTKIKALPKKAQAAQAKRVHSLLQDFLNSLTIFEKFLTGVDIVLLQKTLEDIKKLEEVDVEELKDPWIDEIKQKIKEALTSATAISGLEGDVIAHYNTLFKHLDNLLTDESEPPARGFKALIRSYKKQYGIGSDTYTQLQKALAPLLKNIREIIKDQKLLLMPDPSDPSIIKIEIILNAGISNLNERLRQIPASPLFTYQGKTFNALDLLMLTEFKNKDIKALNSAEKKELLKKARTNYRTLSVKFHPDMVPTKATVQKELTNKGIDVQEVTPEKIFELLTMARDRIVELMAPEIDTIQNEINQLSKMKSTIRNNKNTWLAQLNTFDAKAENIHQNLLYPV